MLHKHAADLPGLRLFGSIYLRIDKPANDTIAASRTMYGSAVPLLSPTRPRPRITARFVDIQDHKAGAAAVDECTCAGDIEPVGDQAHDVLNLVAVTPLAHEGNVPRVVDSASAPALTKPLAPGADIVIQTVTEWIGGHGTHRSWEIVDGGAWSSTPAQLREPDRAIGVTADFGRLLIGFGNVDDPLPDLESALAAAVARGPQPVAVAGPQHGESAA